MMPLRSPLCDGCLASAGNGITALTYDYVDLEQLIGSAGPAGEPVSGTREPKILINVAVEALQRAIWRDVTTWEDAIRDHARLSDPPVRVRDGHAVQRAVGVIGAHLVLLANLGPVVVWGTGAAEVDGAAGILAMARLHRSARSMLGVTRETTSLPGECSACSRHALRRDAGSDTVHCGLCGARWPIDDYERYVALSLGAAA